MQLGQWLICLCGDTGWTWPPVSAALSVCPSLSLDFSVAILDTCGNCLEIHLPWKWENVEVQRSWDSTEKLMSIRGNRYQIPTLQKQYQGKFYTFFFFSRRSPSKIDTQLLGMSTSVTGFRIGTSPPFLWHYSHAPTSIDWGQFPKLADRPAISSGCVSWKNSG